MSVNDILTIFVALAAVAVSIVALVISNAVDKRATRSALTDLAVKIGKKAVAYQQETSIQTNKANGHDVRSNEEDLFVRMKEIEMLVGQADFLVYRIQPGFFARRIPRLARKPRYPVSVAVTFAQALEAVTDPWWADRYWDISVQTDDEHFRALTYKYWGMALCDRGEYQRGRRKVYEGYDVVSSQTASECIFRGDICASMIKFDTDRAECWRYAAIQEYRKISKQDALYRLAEARIKLYGPCTSCPVDVMRVGKPDIKSTNDEQSMSDLPCRQITRGSDAFKEVRTEHVQT